MHSLHQSALHEDDNNSFEITSVVVGCLSIVKLCRTEMLYPVAKFHLIKIKLNNRTLQDTKEWALATKRQEFLLRHNPTPDQLAF